MSQKGFMTTLGNSINLLGQWWDGLSLRNTVSIRLRHLAPVRKGKEMCTSMLVVGQGRTAELSQHLRRCPGPGLWKYKAMLPMGGANTEVWGHGLCTNTRKVNSSWWTQKKPTHKSHKNVPTHCVPMCLSLWTTNIYVWRGTGPRKDIAHVKT